MRLRRQHLETMDIEGSEIMIPIRVAKEICSRHNQAGGGEKWDLDYWWFWE